MRCPRWPLALLLAAAACNGHLHHSEPKGAKVAVRVDGIASSSARSKLRFVVLPGMPNVQPEELLFREFRYQTERALLHEGFIASEDQSAEVAIFLSYGIGEPQLHYETITRPTFGLVPGGTYSVDTQSQTFGSATYTRGTVRERQQLAVTGYKTRTRTKVKYDRFLTVSAVDLAYYKATGKIGEMWRTTVTSIGSSDDLRRIFPVMMAAAMRRLAVSTPGKVDVDITENHPRARYIRSVISATELEAEEANKKRQQNTLLVP
jgi:hypothetical protein